MWNERTLEADIEYAAEMVREGIATEEQAAHACGIPLLSLRALLAGNKRSIPQSDTNTSDTLKGSIPATMPDAGGGAHPASQQDNLVDAAEQSSAAAETTDYFVFYREENRWVWKRVDQDGKIVKTCEDYFQFYLDCVADARPHGFNGRPLFIFAASDIAALNAPDKPR
jgi:hypothetical protein